ncbi:MAG: hypothetical protein U9P73_01905 [Candidatus Cloacimonadota bacterium]|nr:hypothetical protein [Candidatus Cloacimonadota bacterium]
MQNYEVVNFQHAGEDYEIRVISDGETVTIKAFTNGEPANGYVYQINLMTAFDLKKLIGMDAIKNFIKLAEDDVRKNRWKKFLAALEQTNHK